MFSGRDPEKKDGSEAATGTCAWQLSSEPSSPAAGVKLSTLVAVELGPESDDEDDECRVVN